MKFCTYALLSFVLWEPHDKDMLSLLKKARATPEEIIERTSDIETQSASRVHIVDEINCSGLLPCLMEPEDKLTALD